MSDTEEFEEQLRQEQLAKAKEQASSEIEHGRVRKDSDGTEFEWDGEKKAWFPKIDADFIAAYNMQYGGTELKTEEKKEPPADIATNPDAYWKFYYSGKPPAQDDPNYAAWYSYYYGSSSATATATVSEDGPAPFDPAYPAWYYKQLYGVEPDITNPEYLEWAKSVQNATAAEGEEADEAEEGKDTEESKDSEEGRDGEPKAKKKKPEPKWFDQDNTSNTSVYIQGLPTDITETELQEIMTKCGLIAFDYEIKKLKLKLYVDKNTGEPKGDALCTYIKRESVELAMQLLDESDVRGSTMTLEPAKFELKGHFDPKLRRKPKNNKAKRREKEKQEKLLDWRPDKLPDERSRSEKTVVLKNIFDSSEFDQNPTAIQEIREDLRQECSKYGEIKKLTIHDRNSDGVVTITYKEFEEADLCIKALHHRWFASRRIMASNWDGREKFEVKETAEQEAERIRKWEEYLKSGGDSTPGENPPAATSDKASATGENPPDATCREDSDSTKNPSATMLGQDSAPNENPPAAASGGDSSPSENPPIETFAENNLGSIDAIPTQENKDSLSRDKNSRMETDSVDGPSPSENDAS